MVKLLSALVRVGFVLACLFSSYVFSVEKQNVRNVVIPSLVTASGAFSSQQSASNNALRSVFGLSQNDTLRQQRVNIDLAGNRHTKFQQYYKDIPIWGEAVFLHHSTHGEVRATGHVIKGLDQSSMASSLSYGMATTSSRSDVIDSVLRYKQHNSMHWQVRDVTASLIIYLEESGVARKAYVVNYVAEHAMSFASYSHSQMGLSHAEDTIARPFVIVDADSLSVIKEWEGLAHAQIGTGPGGNEKIGRYEYGVDHGYLDVQRVGQTCTMDSENVKTINLNHGRTNTAAFSYSCPRNTEKTINGAFSPLNDAHYFGNVIYEMFQEWLSVAPLTFKLQMRVHFDNDFQNAFWDGSSMTFGDGGSLFYPLIDINIAAHEVAHGFTEQNSGLVYFDQPGGINEAFSDIAGEAAEFYLRGSVDWFVGSDVMKHADGLRFFEDPTRDGESIGHAANYYGGLDVHYSSGVYNRAFFLLSTTAGWNVRKAFEVFANANMNYWGAFETYDTGACGVLEAAKDLRYNANHVDSAFQTVGVDCGYIPFIDVDQDEMDDNWELSFGLNPNNPADAQLDQDNDGLVNLQEYLNNTYPNNVDSDGDRLNDGAEVNEHGTNPTLVDTDVDGLSDYDELETYQTNPLSSDTDGDSLPDQWEIQFDLNPLVDDSALDGDEDGLTNAEEFLNGSFPNDADSDDDQLTDLTEFELGTNLNDPDTDDDGLLDGEEVNLHATNPLSDDTDLDGMGDGFEVNYALNPLDSSDANQDFDSDGYTNLDEFEYRTDPTDPESKPNFISISFEGSSMPVRWTTPSYAESSWVIDTSVAQDGAQSLSPQLGSESDSSTVEFESEFQANSVSFWYKTQSESCCDYLRIYINDSYLFSVNGSVDWTRYDLELPDGLHVIRFEYTKDGYEDDNDGTAWIDNVRFILPDDDLDGMPNLWEDLHGFDRYDSSDAALDFDSDTLTNLEEYSLATNPLLLDSDEDGLSDSAEVNIYGTSPSQADTDQDGVSDGFEVTYGFDPLNPADASLDFDGDGFTNLDEFNFNTDPTDASDKPLLRIISFEDGAIPNDFFVPDSADGGWQIDATTSAQDGSISIRASEITHYETAQISLTSGFGAGSLSFWSKASTEGCCDYLRVFLDDELVTSRSGNAAWQKHEISLEDGTHTLRFVYSKDGSVDTGSDTVWIDNIRFISPDDDSDGMPNFWEEQFGLNKSDASDALTDLDSDGLNNLEEFNLGTNPTEVDSDNDGLSDFDEVNTYLTSPISADTDGDIMTDGYEVTNSFDPISALDGALDADNDGYSNAAEAEQGSDPRDASDLPTLNIVSFEGAGLPHGWIKPDSADAGWELDALTQTPHGNKSLRSSPIGSYGRAEIEFSVYVSANSFSFMSKTSTQSCCDILQVFIDDSLVLSQSGVTDWVENTLDIAEGNRTIRFVYKKNYSSEFGLDTVWIDNIRYRFPDLDSDGMPDLWEEQYGLDKLDASDAALDSDSDSLSNLEEFALGTNPLNTDSDSDGLSDSDEVNVYLTSPSLADTDSDGMYDGFEVTYSFDPLDQSDGQLDADGDGYTNADESELGTHPRDDTSIPQIELISFVDERLSHLWSVPNEARFDWGVDATQSQHQTGALKASYASSSSEKAVIEFTSYFAADSLSFWTKVENDNCCAYLYVYIDDRRVLYSNSYHDWTKRVFALTEGQHTIRFEYYSSAGLSDDTEGAWIDNIRYIIPDADADGLPNSWEDQYGLNRNDAADASSDLDNDTLTNLQEFELGTQPNNIDSDGDTLSDADEVNLHGTLAHLADSDQDGMRDDFELTYSFDPLSSSDGALDTDSDGYSNADEGEFDSDPRDPSSFPSIELVSFNDLSVPENWRMPDDADAGWQIDANETQHLNGSIKADYSSGLSSIEFSAYFARNSLSFWSKMEESRCCSYFRVYLDGRQVIYSGSTHDWTLHQISLSEGLHTIKFVVDYSSSVDQERDGVWIDNIRFQFPDDDGDGMPNTWEDLYGLDRNDPSDAHLDLDNDTLDNLMEFHLETNPASVDTDNDTLSDIDEINLYGTSPNEFDTDADGMHDGFEIEHAYDPLDGGDGNLDTDGDGYNNADESEFDTNPRDATSYPDLVLYTFSDSSLPATWEIPDSAEAGWEIDTSVSKHLEGSLRAISTASTYANSEIEFTEYFAAGSVKLWSKMSLDNCCGAFYMTVDGYQVISTTSPHDWTERSISVAEGWHTIKIGARSSGTNNVWIDNVRYQFPDADADGMPDGWEATNGLDPLNASDAATDLDNDAVSNLMEFRLRLDPNSQDTDGDSLSDGEELNQYGTDPTLSDTDSDGMGDGFELTYGFDPINSEDGALDEDEDGFTNADEFESGTNPTDASSLPDIKLMTFSGSELPPYWVTPADSAIDWVIDTTESQHLSGSLRAQNATESSGHPSIIEYTSFFDANSLSFWTKMDNEYCCNYLRVYVDDARVIYLSGNHEWTKRQINLSEGEHTIRFEFTSSTSSETNGVWIDNLRYRLSDQDDDGMPDGWEDKYGLDKASSADAGLDLDNDTLTNLQEYLLGGNPSVTDTDDDGLNDGDEYSVYGTSIIQDDSDKDGMPDGYEVAQGFDPLNIADGDLDFDGDGFSNTSEYRYQTDPNDALDIPLFEVVSFEQGVIPYDWTVPLGANNGWEVDFGSDAQHGRNSLRASSISHGERAQIEFTNNFVGNTISFWTKTETESCCDRLVVYVDNAVVIDRRGFLDWEEHTLELSEGPHTVRFEYYKDGSVDRGADTVWIDNIRFIAEDSDEDGMPDYWEDLYDLEKNNPSDAELDRDDDGLSNRLEFIYETNPLVSDTDEDGLSDGQEVLVVLTDPLLADTDLDGVNDSLDAFPLDFAASVDNDGDNLPDEWNQGCNLQCQTNSDLSLDRSPNDLDNDGLSDDIDPDNSRDSLGPVIYVPANIVIASTGLETTVNFGQASAEDFVDGTVTVTSSSHNVFQAGRHFVEWVASDLSGNTTTAYQTIDVLPEVKFTLSNQTVEEGNKVMLHATLSGDAPSYPAVVPFIIQSSSTASYPQDHNAREGYFVFNDVEDGKPNASYEFDVHYEDVVTGEPDETIIFHMVSANNLAELEHAYLGDAISQTVTVLEINEQPEVGISIHNNNIELTQVSSGSTVTVEAVILDPNPEDSHVVEWRINDVFVSSSHQFQLNGSDLQEGANLISVEIRDDGEPSLSASASRELMMKKESKSSGGSASLADIFFLLLLVGLSGWVKKRGIFLR